MENTRRTFLKTLALGAGAALALPASGMTAQSYSRIAGANDRVRLAVMGVNGRGGMLARNFSRLQGSEVVYVADVDQRAMERTVASVAASQQTAPRGIKDFRTALDDAGVDGLVIAAPNHWHGPATILGCAAGKHVYVEKPASHNPHEGEMMVEAARKHKRIVQMGNQRRSWPVIIDAIAELQAGSIGELHYSRSWYARARDPIGEGKEAPVPAWLDYELWQGPAPRVPYRDNVIHYNWHWFWRWGNGEAGNNGVHTVDLSRWGLGVTYPSQVVATGGHFFADDDAETPDTQVLTFKFPDGKYIMWEGQSANGHGMMENSGVGVSFHGDKGALVISGLTYRIYDRADRLVKEVNPQNGRKVTEAGGRELGAEDVHLYNFIQAVQGQAKHNSDIEEGHRSTLLTQLANISYRTGRILKTDPKTGRILGDPEAAALWQREYAPGWKPQV